ncbi:ABC transporter, ATP binding protein related protein [mine drainage metagenome]|uniref:ABC transporter, ATP binding protein related protein n=2 Tax=mine drainage metagenome TaxID=410659 RepID=T1BW60_9ZZZZ
MTAEPLWAENLRKVYPVKGAPPVEALAGVSMAVHPGERVALLGRNGAGKTTFLRIASTLLRPTSGTIRVFGYDVDVTPERARPYIAVVPQEGKPFFHLCPREQIYTYLRARGLSRETAKSRTEESLERMGLVEVADRLAITLSGGQRQRTMVATVIATQAPLLFLDEPTIGMDPFARREVWASLRDLTTKGSTILLTTHYLDEAEALSHRLYIVERGAGHRDRDGGRAQAIGGGDPQGRPAGRRRPDGGVRLVRGDRPRRGGPYGDRPPRVASASSWTSRCAATSRRPWGR